MALGGLILQPVCLSAKQKGEPQSFIRPFSTHNSLCKVGRERGSGSAFGNPGFSGIQTVESEIVHDGLNGWRLLPQPQDAVSELLCPMAK